MSSSTGDIINYPIPYTNIALGYCCSFFINSDGDCFGIGDNSNFKLGVSVSSSGSLVTIDSLKNIKMISCGYEHTLCCDYDGNVFAFGRNQKGQLGIEQASKESNLPKTIGITNINIISCGNNFTVCLNFDGYLFSFGDNSKGQLGLGVNTSIISKPQLINNINDVELFNCGDSFVICKTYSSEIYSWGDNDKGQLGQGNHINCNIPVKCINYPPDIIDIKCGKLFALFLSSYGKLYGTGQNYYGQLGLGEDIEFVDIPTIIPNIPLIKQIDCGSFYSLAIDIQNRLWVFGSNIHGQLGVGDTNKRKIPILNDSIQDVIEIKTGGFHSFFKTRNNEIYSCGYNSNVQLGVKTPNNQTTPIQVFKDNYKIWPSIFKSRAKSARN